LRDSGPTDSYDSVVALPDRDVQRYPPGHFHSPIPDAQELAERREELWPAQPRATPGIDWRPTAQRELCRVFAEQQRLVFPSGETGDRQEYFTENGAFPALDAWVLEAMLRHLRPARVIEIGSGFSSLVTARVNRELLSPPAHFICIEPYPADFLLAGVPGISEVRVERVQMTPLEIFMTLDNSDVLFIDSSHVVKTGSDVVWLFEEILPRLSAGVAVHLHDIFLPGDYPPEWVLDGVNWNEGYLLHAFLAFNHVFDVLFGVNWMKHYGNDELLEAFPGARQAWAGGSFWMRRRSGGE